MQILIFVQRGMYLTNRFYLTSLRTFINPTVVLAFILYVVMLRKANVCRVFFLYRLLFVLCFSFGFLHLVYPMFPVALDCFSLIAPSILFNVYLYLYRR